MKTETLHYFYEMTNSNSIGFESSDEPKDHLSSVSSSSSSSSPFLKLIMVHQMCSLADRNNNNPTSNSSTLNNYESSERTHFSVGSSSSSSSATLRQRSHHNQHSFYHNPFYSSWKHQHQAVLIVFYFVAIFVCSSIPVAAGIDCFKCVSLNGDNPSCEDPFHNNYSISILESPCMGGRKGRNGLFPATACIKLAGRYYETGETITVRGCALDSGTLNVDTEIIRMSHCGHFWFDNRYVKGCLQSCDDADGCNGSSRPSHFSIPVSILTATLTVLFLIVSINGTAGLSANIFFPNLVHHHQQQQHHNHHRRPHSFHLDGESREERGEQGGEIQVL